MYLSMLVVFILGYTLIAFEHNLKIDKAASALLAGSLCWAIFALGLFEIDINSDNFGKFLTYFQTKDLNYTSEFIAQNVDYVKKNFVLYELSHHLAEIGQILFFLLGAMTIVELVDAHQGFSVITDRIKTNNKVKLMWILCILSFFFSATLDNLTTAIVMSALLTKLIEDKKDLWLFAGMIIISANAGGAWSPIGDVTTIMLWIGGQVTAANIITSVLVPSLVCMIAPLIYLTFKLKGNITRPSDSEALEHIMNPTTPFERKFIFFLGVGGLLFVPVFKTVTHLPPYIGILLSLGVMWLTTELLHRSKNYEAKSDLTVIGVLKKVDVPTIFFFLGILLAVASLQSMGHLNDMAKILDNTFDGNIYAINIIIGLLSAIVDNVPLVAGAMGMYEIGTGVFAVDGSFWEFLAYCAGTGGSVLIIGSAAGVAVMGILKIDFIWYVKKISFLAFIGYIAGAITYILMQ
ncbi:MAG: sodium:proton antiporter NhaD [Flavobacteriales bacterium]|nr:sodium:proton antiporter NhaD [Flavobacteriales bacterium]